MNRYKIARYSLIFVIIKKEKKTKKKKSNLQLTLHWKIHILFLKARRHLTLRNLKNLRCKLNIQKAKSSITQEKKVGFFLSSGDQKFNKILFREFFFAKIFSPILCQYVPMYFINFAQNSDDYPHYLHVLSQRNLSNSHDSSRTSSNEACDSYQNTPIVSQIDLNQHYDSENKYDNTFSDTFLHLYLCGQIDFDQLKSS